MDAYEIDEALRGFSVICDTREQNTPKAERRLQAINAPIRRETLSYGDYCADVPIGAEKSLYASGKAICPKCVIERKMSIDELAACFTRGRDRFRREFERASANDAKVFLLVENATWEGIMFHRYRSKFNSNAFIASITAWMARYGFIPVFCKADVSGAMIKEILYRDMKERLERGEYG